MPIEQADLDPETFIHNFITLAEAYLDEKDQVIAEQGIAKQLVEMTNLYKRVEHKLSPEKKQKMYRIFKKLSEKLDTLPS